MESGSFAAAARRLGRASSVISYAIANLESQLGVVLFERAGTAPPRLTDAGRAILSDSQGVARALDGLMARARGLTEGLEPEVSLVVDVMLPAKKFSRALDDFRRRFPSLGLKPMVEALGAVTQTVMEGKAVFGVSGPLAPAEGHLTRGPAGTVKLLAVAAPNHPLAQLEGPISASSIRDHVQLVLTDRSALTQGRDWGVLSEKTWRLADLGAKHALLLAGMGWGSMPKPMVNEDLKRGRLLALQIEMPTYSFHTVYRNDRRPGPAAAWLMERLAQTDYQKGGHQKKGPRQEGL